jgi:acetyltransferase-like isoleucine patch superfamily enzyme
MECKNIQVEELHTGINVIIEESAIIKGIHGKAKKVIIGDNVYIGKNVQIICDEFSIGDYSRVHHGTTIHGYQPCVIGHNAWIGQYAIIDSIGGTNIGNNCGIGAHSQLWSHIKFGDTLEGCRFLSDKPLAIGNDVWFVGHCIVSPITAADKSMALAGAVVTKDMEFNTIYSGCPAKPISDKIGFQFKQKSTEEKMGLMKKYISEAKVDQDKIRIVASVEEFKDDGRTYFAVNTRQYLKTRSEAEIAFMKFLLPEKAKFTPIKR